MPSDDNIDDVMKGIIEALDSVQMPNSEARRVLLLTIRESMEEIAAEDGVRPRRRGRPDVRVVEGGRGDEPPSTGARPQLRVAEAEPDDDAPTDVDEPPMMGSSLMEFGGDDADQEELDRLMNGFISVEDRRRTQMIFLGPVPRPYRLSIDEGSVWVEVVGEEPFLLDEGQRVDVEARRIQICLVEECLAATGIYQRLPRS